MHGGRYVLTALGAVCTECMGDVLYVWGAVLSAWLGSC